MDRKPALLVLLFVILATRPAAAQEDSFADVSAATATVAERYFEAYVALDWTTLAPLLADRATFADPTAELVFGAVESSGKTAVLQRFEEGYAAIASMHFDRSRAVFSGAHAIFEGTLDWTLRLSDGHDAVTEDMPFLTILRIEAGQVVEHRDYADYQPFLDAVHRARSGD